jgi:hypothetical protein
MNTGESGKPAPAITKSDNAAHDPARRRALAILSFGVLATLEGAAAFQDITGYSIPGLVNYLLKGSVDEVQSHLERDLDEFGENKDVLERRNITAVLNAISLARKSVYILGINALGPLHQAVEKLEDLLSKGKIVSVGVMNPLSENFILRERQECMTPGKNVVSSRLSFEWVATFGILQQLRLRCGRGKLDAWMHDLYPPGSLVMVDREIVQYNPYKQPEPVACPKKGLVPRGITGPMGIFSKQSAPEDVRKFYKEYSKLRASGRRLDLRSFDLVTSVVGRASSGSV